MSVAILLPVMSAGLFNASLDTCNWDTPQQQDLALHWITTNILFNKMATKGRGNINSKNPNNVDDTKMKRIYQEKLKNDKDLPLIDKFQAKVLSQMGASAIKKIGR